MNHDHHHPHVHHPSGLKQAKDPVCGMTVSPDTAKWKHEHQGQTYFFCNPRCLAKFQAEPEKYAPAQPGKGGEPTPGSGGCGGCCKTSRTDPVMHIANDGKVAEPAHLPAPPKPASGQGTYTCPMHPEVRNIGPGSCPDCGMALEPLDPTETATRTEYICPMHPEVVRAEPGACPICGMALEPRTITLEDAPNPELADMSRRFWMSVPLSLIVLVLGMSEMIPGPSRTDASTCSP
jgi:P-type Cu+ transporter